MSDEDRQAIDQRKKLIEDRARALAGQALAARDPWTRRFGTPPASRDDRDRWLAALTTVAAYRDRYDITSNQPAGGGADNDAQRADRQCALQAARIAAAIGTPAEERRGPTVVAARTLSAP